MIYEYYVTYCYESMEEEQLRCRPHAAVNPVAWCFWHMARAEDAAVNLIVARGTQVLDTPEQGRLWTERMGVPHRHNGSGMAPDDVDALARTVDLGALHAYQWAVHRRTLAVVAALDPATLDEVPGAQELERVYVGQGVLHPRAGWIAEIAQGKTRGWFLFNQGLTHQFHHIGEIHVAAGMLGVAFF